MTKHIIFILFFTIKPAYAYLDPASGSAILYIVVALVTSIIFYSKSLLVIGYAKLLILFKKENMLDKEVVMYSEGKQYWNTFLPLIEEFLKNNHKLTYLTSSKDDPILKINNESLTSKYIGNEVLACSYLNYLSAKLLITTTPQLNVFILKKTKKIKHYAHIVHAPIDVHTYRKFAFDFYDSVLCSGPHQIKSIKALEQLRGTKPKQLFETGLLYYDKTQKIKHKSKAHTLTILIAPTWKEYSLLNQCGVDLLKALLSNEKFQVILRPHPQSFVSFKELTDTIIEEFSPYPNFSLDREKSGDLSMSKSDIMISDLSGIVWDYIFVQEKPVLLFDTPNNLVGFEDTEIPHISWEKTLIKEHLETFNTTQGIIDKVNLLVSSWNEDKFRQERSNSIYNFQDTASTAYNQLTGILNEVKKNV